MGPSTVYITGKQRDVVAQQPLTMLRYKIEHICTAPNVERWIEIVQFLVINCIPFQLIVVLLGRLFFLCSQRRWTMGRLRFMMKVKNWKYERERDGKQYNTHTAIIIIVIICYSICACASVLYPSHALLSSRSRRVCTYARVFAYTYILNESTQHRDNAFGWIKFNICSTLWPNN